MQIEYCPKCGAADPGSDIDGDPSCSNCDWYYGTKEYRRIGTHPREFDRYCEECVTVYETAEEAQTHLCTVGGLLEEYGGPWPIEALLEELTEYHGESRAERRLRSAVKENEVVHTEDFTELELWPSESLPDLAEVVYDEIEAQEQSGGEVGVDDLAASLGASDELAGVSVRNCLRELRRTGEIQWGISGVKTA